MGNTLSIELDSLTVAKAELLSGFLLTLAEAYESAFTGAEDAIQPLDERVPAPAADPVAAFGPDPKTAFGAVPPPPPPAPVVSQQGPVLELPAGTVNNVPALPGPGVVTNGQIGLVPPPPPAAADVDAKGYPWDGRIHAAGKSKNKDGTWRGKRGVAPALVAQVESELRAVMAIPGPLASAPTAGAAQTVQSASTTGASPTATTAPSGPQLVPPPPPAAAPAQPDATVVGDLRTRYVTLWGVVSSSIVAGKLTDAQVSTCLTSVGIPSLQLLGTRLDLVPQVENLINAIIAGVNA